VIVELPAASWVPSLLSQTWTVQSNLGKSMKKILFAALISVAAASAAIGPTRADAMADKGHDHMHMRKHCHTRLVTHWRHHHKVVEKVRVCN